MKKVITFIFMKNEGNVLIGIAMEANKDLYLTDDDLTNIGDMVFKHIGKFEFALIGEY